MIAPVVILALVTLQRLAELGVAHRHTRALLARGAYEVGAGHYPLIVAVHAGWLISLWLAAPGRAVIWPLIALFVLLQGLRLWVLATLGERWTTRIIVLPGSALVAGGPYRWFRHPNYLVVIGEIALLPLAFGLVWIAVVFTFLNAGVLIVRTRVENRMLAAGTHPA